MANYCSECTYLDLTSGDLNGKFWCEKKLERHLASELECDRFCRCYNRDESVSKSAYQYSNNHSSSSGCFLTTIICNTLKLPDNNFYLNTMRNFRDSVLQNDEKYKQLLVEYDIVGPKISESLKNDPLKETIAFIYFNEYIKPITELIINRETDKAVNLYCTMTEKLKAFYGFQKEYVTLEDIKNADIKASGHGSYKVKTITLVLCQVVLVTSKTNDK